MKHVFHSQSAAETKRIARALGKKIRAQKVSRGVQCILLSGELGSGKTTFAQGFARGLGIRARVHSPTFILMKRYPIAKSYFQYLIHIDCYRVRHQKEMAILGLKKMLDDPRTIFLIEWPERIKKLLPRKNISIIFTHTTLYERTIGIHQ